MIKPIGPSALFTRAILDVLSTKRWTEDQESLEYVAINKISLQEDDYKRTSTKVKKDVYVSDLAVWMISLTRFTLTSS